VLPVWKSIQSLWSHFICIDEWQWAEFKVATPPPACQEITRKSGGVTAHIGMKLTIYCCLMLRLRMHGAKPHFLNMPSWHAQG